LKQSYFEPSAAERDSTGASPPSSPGVSTSLRGSRLAVTNARRDDSGFYVCTAQNEFGSDSFTVQLIVLESPDPPADVKLIDITSRTVMLAWNIDFDGNSPPTATFIEMFGDVDESGILLYVCSGRSCSVDLLYVDS
jgi:Immunoglobulin I-set domain